ncbi:MAG: LysR family transcriptional regulator [Bacteroidia bacterium]|nr:LysR family transcriptional regulator [Bacteroidia bacterium]
MDFRLLVFKKVADHLSYTKAARELHISQPAVSKHINKLEEQFEKALILREGNRISLTPEGELLLRYANQILDLYKQLSNDFLALNDRIPEKIILGASTTITQYILPELLAAMKQINPSVQISLINGNTEKIEQLIESNQVDLGFTEGKPSNPLLHYEKFRKDEIVLATRSSNRKLKKEELKIEEVKKIPLISREEGSGTRKVIESALAQQGVSSSELNIELEIGSTEGIKTYLLNSDAFAFVSIHSIFHELKANMLKIIDVKKLEIIRDFHYVHLHGKQSQAMKFIKRILTSSHNNLE